MPPPTPRAEALIVAFRIEISPAALEPFFFEPFRAAANPDSRKTYGTGTVLVLARNHTGSQRPECGSSVPKSLGGQKFRPQVPDRRGHHPAREAAGS